METTLVVVCPFGAHATGDRITDPAAIAAALASDHADKVVAVQTPAKPTTDTPTTPAKGAR